MVPTTSISLDILENTVDNSIVLLFFLTVARQCMIVETLVFSSAENVCQTI